MTPIGSGCKLTGGVGGYIPGFVGVMKNRYGGGVEHANGGPGLTVRTWLRAVAYSSRHVLHACSIEPVKPATVTRGTAQKSDTRVQSPVPDSWSKT